MKKLLCVLIVIIVLFAFGAEALAETPENRIVSPEESPLFIPVKTARLDGGNTIAVQEGFRVKYLNEEFELLSEIELFSGNSGEIPADCVFSNNGIFMGTKTAIIKSEGEWKLSGGTFFDRDGNIIRELPDMKNQNFDEEIIPIGRIRWVGEDIVILLAEENIFYYRISEDKIYLSFNLLQADGCENNCIANGKAPQKSGAFAVYAPIFALNGVRI